MKTVLRPHVWILLAAAFVTTAAAPAVRRPGPPRRPAVRTAAPLDTAGRRRIGTVRSAFTDALALEQRGDLKDAIMAYRAVVAADSTYPEAHYRMGRLLVSLDRLPDAIKAFRAELKFHRDHVAAQRELGLALARTGETTQALAALEQLTRINPTDDQSWQALGFARSVAGHPAEAEAALRRAIEYPPDRASEHRDLGVLLASMGRENDAREEYRAALALDEADPATWANLGNLESRSGHWQAALDAYRTAEARDSSYALALQGQLVALDALGRGADAAATAERWLATRPDDHRARLDAASRYHQLGRDDVALRLARDGVKRQPMSGDARVVLSSVLDATGRPREALRELRIAGRAFHDPINRGHVVSMINATMAALPESVRVLARADSVALTRRAPARR